jgi:membrane protease subunit (stomatin/prohibitin family)
MFMRRRRPLAAAAMIGGASYLGSRAGQRAAQNEAVEQQQDYETQQRLANLEAQGAAPAGAPQSDLAAKLTELKSLMDQGVLTQDEFNAAKAKLLS